MYGHVITKFSGLGKFTYQWGSAHARAKRARGAPLIIMIRMMMVMMIVIIRIRTASSLLFFFAKLLHAKPKHAGSEAGNREKRGRKPEKKK